MERKGGVIKVEDPIQASFSDSFLMTSYNPSSLFSTSTVSAAGGMLEILDQKSSLGFLELLGMQQQQQQGYFGHDDMGTVEGLLQVEIPPTISDNTAEPTTETTSEVENTPTAATNPATPNSSSLSSASSGAADVQNNATNKVAVDEEEQQQQQQHHQNTQKQLKTKKTSEKKQKEPRFAFMTKSEVDHLEDGYRWRKYGQKAVKNSPFPRGYYRCTTASCNVKKRVERSFSDPDTVVTTYEGQHTHLSPVMARPSHAGPAYALPVQMNLPQQYYYPQLNNNNIGLNCGYNMISPNATNVTDGRRFQGGGAPSSTFLIDNGLLQDIVPSVMRKEEEY